MERFGWTDEVGDKINVAALDLALPAEHVVVLDAASATAAPRLIDGLSRPPMRLHIMFGGSTVRSCAERPAPRN